MVKSIEISLLKATLNGHNNFFEILLKAINQYDVDTIKIDELKEILFFMNNNMNVLIKERIKEIIEKK